MSYQGRGYGPQVTLQLPPVTTMVKWLLIALSVAFAVQTILGSAGMPILELLFALQPQQTLIPIEYVPWLWQLLTYSFLHGGLWHLLFNLLALYMFGGDVEFRLGSKGLLRYFLICVFGGGALHLLLNGFLGSQAPLIGASAGVLGVILAFALFNPYRPVMVFPIPAPIPAWVLAAVIAAIDLYAAIQANPTDTIAHFAHLGGMAAGFLYLKRFTLIGKVFSRLRRNRRKFDVIPGDRRGPWR